MLELGDIVKVKSKVWSAMFAKGRAHSKPPEGPVRLISPAGARRIMIKDCGFQFRQEDVDLLYVDIDISEYN